MNLPMLYMVSWGQFSGSLEFTEGWGFFALSLSKQISIFDFPCMSGQAEWADLLSAARSLGLQLLTDNSLQPPPSPHSVPGLASLCLSSVGTPGWSFVWGSLYPGTHFSQRLPHACATDPGFDEQHWAAVLDFARWRHRRVLCPRVKP